MSWFARPLTDAQRFVRDCAQHGLRAEWLGQSFGSRGQFRIIGLAADDRVLLTTTHNAAAQCPPGTVRAWLTR